MKNDTSKALKKLVERRHPDFAAREEHWGFLQDTYRSSKDWFVKNIFRFSREGDDTHAGRVERAFRFNHTREVVDLVNKYLFKVAPKRKEVSEKHLQDFRVRATLSGLTLNEFEQEASRKSSMFGRVYCVLDNNLPPTAKKMSVAAMRRAGVRLYAYLVDPIHFLDCGFDKEGQLNWALIREMDRDDDDPFTSTGDIRDRYRLWTRTHCYLYELDGERVDEIDVRHHNLGVVPVIKCDHIESDAKYSVPSLIEDIAYLDRAVANYLSNLDQIINDQTFSQLVMPVQSMLNGASAAAATDASDPDAARLRQELVKMGTAQVMLYDGESGSGPAYIGPDPRQATLIITAIKQVVNEIYHSVGLAGERTKQDNAAGIDNSSGVAKAFDFERVNALLAMKAKAMEIFSNRLETLVQIYHGASLSMADPQEKSVLYSTSFDVLSLRDELAIAQELSLLSAPMELRKRQMKSLTGKLWPMQTEKDANDIASAIDSWQDLTYSSVSTDLPPRGSSVQKPNKQGQNNKEADEKPPGQR